MRSHGSLQHSRQASSLRFPFSRAQPGRPVVLPTQRGAPIARRVDRSGRDPGSQARQIPPFHHRRRHWLHLLCALAQPPHLFLLLTEEPIKCSINCPNGAEIRFRDSAWCGRESARQDHLLPRGRADYGFGCCDGDRSECAGFALVGLCEVGEEML